MIIRETIIFMSTKQETAVKLNKNMKSIIADSFKDKRTDNLFWKTYLKKSVHGFDSDRQQIIMTEYGDSLLRKRNRGIQLFNSL